MLRKLLTAALACAMLSCSAAASSLPAVEVADAEKNEITVSGNAAKNDYVTLMILNPGVEPADLTYDDYVSLGEKIQYFSVQRVKSDRYFFRVTLDDAGQEGGRYGIYVTAGETPADPAVFEYYFQEARLAAIPPLNGFDTAKGMEAAIDGTVRVFGLSGDPLYAKDAASEIASALFALRAGQPLGKFEEEDDAAMLTLLREALLVAAYNRGAAALYDGGGLKYADTLLGLSGTTPYADFTHKLSPAGRDALAAKLLSGNYASAGEIAARFKALMAFYGIKYNAQSGYGHIDHYISEYGAYYTDAGFRLSSLTGDNRKAAYSALLTASASDLAGLAEAFNAALKSGGGGGSGSATKSGAAAVSKGDPSNYFVAEETAPVKPTPFGDLARAEWAREAVEALFEKGVLSGKEQGVFAPDDFVTRAEFAKIIVGAFQYDLAQGAGTAFDDVAENDWFFCYVNAAAQADLVFGEGKSFFPNKNVTREDAVTILNRVLSRKGLSIKPGQTAFSDHADISGYAGEAVGAFKAGGLISGKGDNRFLPRDHMTRAEAAQMVYNVMNYAGGAQ